MDGPEKIVLSGNSQLLFISDKIWPQWDARYMIGALQSPSTTNTITKRASHYEH